MPSTTPPHERYAAHLRTPSPNSLPDAGLRGLTHYERRLPRWRFRLRQRLIPLVRWETAHLAALQEACRSPWLDSYFALSANLGTHTFFMTALPICFWCGFPDMGVALVQMLAMGVYVSGFVKDLVCLPRPLSPPLHRITMSGSAAMEYGFPSTHTTNAVSVATFCLFQLYTGRQEGQEVTTVDKLLRTVFWCYAVSITLGRMYCGMHGFFDVVIGGLLGGLIAWIRIAYGIAFDSWILSGTYLRPLLVVVTLTVAVRIHPEPADNCPCFDDSVSFVGVVMGIEVGMWHYTQLTASHQRTTALLAATHNFSNDSLPKTVARVVLGIAVIFLWRAVMKPLLLGYLPPIFRFVDNLGVRLPRRYFLQSRDYKTVPALRRDDNIIPPASEIPAMLSSFRHPRKRTISIGPQSEADARELIADRQQRKRRDSREQHSTPVAVLRSERSTSRPFLAVDTTAPRLLTPPPSDGGGSDSGVEDERRDREMFEGLERPRIRYDVEVITKLVVYAGIAWLAVEGNPLLFQRLSLV